jgi:DNA mismatch endonuclease (patch repair protein)
MPDNLSKEDRIRTMRAVKGKGTGPERRVRGMLAGLGLRGWLVNPEGITGKPDFAFPEEKVAIFVDGCFWHRCPICDRPLPESNKGYWERKIQRNVERDRKYTAQLEAEGWRVMRIWGHQLKKNMSLDPIAEEVKALLDT